MLGLVRVALKRPYTFVVFQLDPDGLPEEAAQLDYDQRDLPWGDQ